MRSVNIGSVSNRPSALNCKNFGSGHPLQVTGSGITNNINRSTNINVNKALTVYSPVNVTNNIDTSTNISTQVNIDNVFNHYVLATPPSHRQMGKRHSRLPTVKAFPPNGFPFLSRGPTLSCG